MSDFLKTIKFKISVSFFACIALMVAIGLSGLAGAQKIAGNSQASYSSVTMPIVQISEGRSLQLKVRVALRRMQALRTDSGVRESVPKLESDLQKLDRVWADYARVSFSDTKERLIAETVSRELPAFKSSVDDIVVMLKADNFDAADSAIAAVEQRSDALGAALEEDAGVNAEKAKQFMRDSASTYKSVLWTCLACIAAGVLIGFGVSLYLTRAITTPLSQAVGIARRIAEGKLDNRVSVFYQDEFGALLDALKTMDAQLSATVREIKTASEAVSTAADEIANGNADLSARTETQAASLEETAASMTQLTETVRGNADNAREANALAANATTMADEGNELMQNMVGTIARISESSAKISEITSVIEGIAFQTNILALNAAVEAARAGEQGRGFAVVAGEVRSLAQRSAAAAKEIKELIGTSVEMIESGSQQAANVGVTMGQVKDAIKRVAETMGDIAVASTEQSRGIEQVGKAVVQMDGVTQQNAALVGQAAAAAQSLKEQAANLRRTVASFAVGETSFP
ncbi:MAG: HAMP domain-containing protein [Paraburkholderia sp.]|nr:MAG: HAMP domain-containing protein [Paraburkholderia sp.]